KKSILERIRSAKTRNLGMSSTELGNEIARLAEQGDEPAKKELRNIVDAYLSWELRHSRKKQSSDAIHLRVLENFDVYANAADHRLSGLSDEMALYAANHDGFDGDVRKTRQFYRDVTDYNLSCGDLTLRILRHQDT